MISAMVPLSFNASFSNPFEGASDEIHKKHFSKNREECGLNPGSNLAAHPSNVQPYGNAVFDSSTSLIALGGEDNLIHIYCADSNKYVTQKVSTNSVLA